MWRQARNNREMNRPTPAVPKITCVLSRGPTAMTTIDISLSAEQVCSTERACRRSGNFKEHATWHIRDSSNIPQILFWLFPGE